MQRIPPSYSDQVLAAAVDGMEVTLGEQRFELKIRNYPAARNGMPRGDYVPVGAVDERTDGQALGRELGQRCQGNTACTPICPVQAKYNAGKTLAQADRVNLQVLAQAVASKIHVDPVSGEVESIEYQRYEDPSSPRHTVHRAQARAYVLAAHAVENAKLMLFSGLGGSSGQLGRNLMDHPCLYAWGLSPVPIGSFRARSRPPGSTTCGVARSAPPTPPSGSTSATTAGAPPPAPPTRRSPTRSSTGGCSARSCAGTWRTPSPARFGSRSLSSSCPPPANGVTIDPDHLDALGNPRPVISYKIDDYTLAGMAAARDVARAMFDRAGITDCTDPDAGNWFPSVTYGGEEYRYHGMGHFAGTHVMGARAEDSVVDRDQRSWDHRNLFLVGSGSFPTMGTSNPTLTMAALSAPRRDPSAMRRGAWRMSTDELKELLEAAVKLELSTIPPYLCALYSIHPDGNDEAKLVIRSVVVEEMLHMILAANVLNAIGGEPRIAGPEHVPRYPHELPDGAILDLLPFSAEAIDAFLKVENPEYDHHALDSGSSAARQAAPRIAPVELHGGVKLAGDDRRLL